MRPQEPYARIKVEQAKAMVDSGQAVIIDVRRDDEWVSGHVKGAIHMVVDDVLARIDELPKDKDLLFICQAGYRSALACEMAAAMGVPTTRLYNVEEGTPVWIAKNLPTSYNNEP
ncbi:MAG: rhodanese-like domain-containing protein [Chloroflexi bacterium]|nr:rhodanese-like domain-containing protein [Chloroflexota bacterium]